MKTIFKLLSAIVLLYSCNSIKKLYTVYGETKVRNETVSTQPEIIRIYFDRMGFVYPDYALKDEQFRESFSYFPHYYQNYPADHKNISLVYQVPLTNPDTIGTASDPIQEAVIKSFVNKLASRRGTYDKLVFLVHGFNKHPEIPEDPQLTFRGNSTAEFAGMRKYITSHFPNTRFQFVEVYWDGLSARNAAKSHAIFNIPKFWNNAMVHANNVGLELRRILSALNNEKVYMISHSLGASVVTTSLFNTRQFSNAAYADKDEDDMQYILLRQSHPKYNTPVINIRAGMFAPAIPGQNIFDEYDQRTINGRDVVSTQKNFSFIIGFNRYDEVITKGINIPQIYGATTLGCVAADLQAAKKEVNNDPAILDDVDFSSPTIKGEGRQSSHSIIDYLNNEHFNIFLDKVFAE